MSTVIDWPGLTDTLNPLGWGCLGPGGTPDNPRICHYCYAAEIARKAREGGRIKVKCQKCLNFEPHYHLDRLKGFTGKAPKTVFIQSMGDLFGDWVSPAAIQSVINFCIVRPQHTFMFLTKYIDGYLRFGFPPNTMQGVTVTTPESYAKIMFMKQFPRPYLSVEPILGVMPDLDYSIFEVVIVGAMTGPGAVKPEPEWIESVKANVPADKLFLKNNIKPYW